MLRLGAAAARHLACLRERRKLAQVPGNATAVLVSTQTRTRKAAPSVISSTKTIKTTTTAPTSSSSSSSSSHAPLCVPYLCNLFVLLLQHGNVRVHPTSLSVAAVPTLRPHLVVFSCEIIRARRVASREQQKRTRRPAIKNASFCLFVALNNVFPFVF